jgi:hypothetical protein
MKGGGDLGSHNLASILVKTISILRNQSLHPNKCVHVIFVEVRITLWETAKDWRQKFNNEEQTVRKIILETLQTW